MSEKAFRIRREEPPARDVPLGRKPNQVNKIDKEVAAFKKHAGTWFKVRENAAGGAYMVYKKRGCEVRTKHLGNGKYDILARYPESTED
jgi:hypothetical protein